ncbi:MAG: helix-turn-helix domain-containing protein [Acidobacteriota bacterium]|nr:helix-turn-helix domain-containing protein [Acidobacteriota bacterium]
MSAVAKPQFNSRDSTEAEALLTTLRALIEREVTERVRPLEEALERMSGAKPGPKHSAEEYLDVRELARRIHTPEDTIRDLVYRKKIPFEKLPTGSVRFPWSKILAWIEGR